MPATVGDGGGWSSGLSVNSPHAASNPRPIVPRIATTTMTSRIVRLRALRSSGSRDSELLAMGGSDRSWTAHRRRRFHRLVSAGSSRTAPRTAIEAWAIGAPRGISVRSRFRLRRVDLQSVERLRSRGGFKWNSYPDDVLAAWVAEMDFGLAPPIAEALRAAIDAGEVGYPYAALEEDTATAACSFWSDRLGWEVEPSQVFPVPDVVEGLRRAIVHLTEPGSPVVLHTPVYYPFFSMVERAGRQLVDVPCQPDADGRYRLDLEATGRALAGGAGCIALCNPWNPTGRACTPADVEAVVELASSKGSRVIADEVHAPLVRGGIQHVVAATV